MSLKKTLKGLLERFIALFLFILLIPIFIILYIVVRLDSKGGFFFKQTRAGKNMKPFIIYKIRTMVQDAENKKSKYHHLNEADGPVFKIKNDPRFTKVGKILAQIGIDEIPQLINIIKGEMSFVGPRPLPMDEAKKVPVKFKKRFSVNPGIFSTWVAKGAFHNDFNLWMQLDIDDIRKKSFFYNLKIVYKSIKIITISLFGKLKKRFFPKVKI